MWARLLIIKVGVCCVVGSHLVYALVTEVVVQSVQEQLYFTSELHLQTAEIINALTGLVQGVESFVVNQSMAEPQHIFALGECT